MLATTYFLMQGTPFIYQGQELGMTSGDFKTIDDFKDVETEVDKIVYNNKGSNINDVVNKILKYLEES